MTKKWKVVLFTNVLTGTKHELTLSNAKADIGSNIVKLFGIKKFKIDTVFTTKNNEFLSTTTTGLRRR